tara:strand:+ start:7380 stop:8645 length:1266 start_codon:yes stop_codon:yes gene_type:complete
MDNILEINNLENYDYNNIKLSNPSIQNGNNYYTNITIGDRDKPLYIQLPKCITKAGCVKNNNKCYTDLIFSASDNRIINWLENFEIYLQNLIYKKKEQWFDTDIDLDDIQELMTPLMRSYKSGKNILVRCNIKNHKCSVYDENEILLNLDNFTNDKEIIPLISVNGIKFSSKNFTIELNLTQIMILSSKDDLEKNCLIKSTKKTIIKDSLDSLSLTQLNNNNLINKNKVPLDIDNQDFKSKQLPLEKNIQDMNIITKNNNPEHLEINEAKNDSELFIENIDLDKIDTNKSYDIKNSKENLDNNILLEIDNKINDNDKVNESINLDNTNDLANLDNLDEVDLDTLSIEEEVNNNISEINIKEPTEIYYEIYKNALIKANTLKRNTIQAFLNAKNIKSKYNLEELDLDIDDEDEYIEEVNSLG